MPNGPELFGPIPEARLLCRPQTIQPEVAWRGMLLKWNGLSVPFSPNALILAFLILVPRALSMEQAYWIGSSFYGLERRK